MQQIIERNLTLFDILIVIYFGNGIFDSILLQILSNICMYAGIRLQNKFVSLGSSWGGFS